MYDHDMTLDEFAASVLPASSPVILSTCRTKHTARVPFRET